MLSPDGFCLCGCGQRTVPCRQTDRRLGNVRGLPQGYIAGHQFHRKPGSHEDMVRRFWAKVNKSDGCWEWTGTLTSTGYGFLHAVHDGKRKPAKAHRLSWFIHNGPIPPGKYVCHKCDNRKCVRPDHLFLGSQSDNMKDAYRKGRIVMPHERRAS